MLLMLLTIVLLLIGRLGNVVIENLYYDDHMDFRKMWGYVYGKRSWMVYGSDLIILLSVYVLSTYSGWSLAFGIVLAVLMYTTWLTDVRESYIYDVFTYPAIVLFLVYGIWFGPYVWWLHVMGGVVILGLLLFLSFVMKGKMGGGDVKLLTALGLYFGFVDMIPVLFLSSVFGIVCGVMLYVKRKESAAFPFGPFIVMGVFVIWLSGFSVLAFG